MGQIEDLSSQCLLELRTRKESPDLTFLHCQCLWSCGGGGVLHLDAVYVGRSWTHKNSLGRVLCGKDKKFGWRHQHCWVVQRCLLGHQPSLYIAAGQEWHTGILCLKHFVWNTFMEYFVWNTLSGILSMEYFVWSTLYGILCMEYFVWNTLSGTLCVEYFV